MGENNIKQVLNTWCSQNKKTSPNYTYKSQGGKGNQRIRFKCEVTVEDINYTGFGSSTNKKDSQTNAARDFVNYLVREGIMSANLVPEFTKDELVGDTETIVAPTSSSYQQPSNYQQDKPLNFGNDGFRSTYLTNLFDQKKLEEAEDVDFTADIHGGWTVDNAKGRLHQYMQVNKIQSDYKYSVAGPDHKRSFVCELSIYCPKLKKNIYARESASNKQQASKACALSLVRQLFHLGVIEASGVSTKKQRTDQIPPFKVDLPDDVKSKLTDTINQLGLKVPKKPDTEAKEETNLVTNYALVDFEPQSHHRPQVIAWSPPVMNWNAWTACNIDEGEEAFMQLTEISNRMKTTYAQRCNNDESYKRALFERSKLPAHASKDIIIQAIVDSRVVLIRGETGSGKTTQIPQYILDHFIEQNRGAECNIIVTQPRRISAITLAERVAQERCELLGQSCGYSVRFDTIKPQPYGGIMYCTIGTLLRKMESGLRGISHIIVDEIHERDCNTDFLMILLKDMSMAYPKMKVILMSATVDIRLFRNFFPNLTTVEVEGRTHPVKFYFLEDAIEMLDFQPDAALKKKKNNRKGNDDDDDDNGPVTVNGKDDDTDVNCNMICGNSYKQSTKMALGKIPEREICLDLIEAILQYIDSIHPDGAVLIFLPGWNIIQMLLKQLSRHPLYGSNKYILLPLHSQVSREDQRRVFHPSPQGVRKIILSTNIAESSVTINDVMFVIDSCRAKVKMFTSRNNMTSYNTVWASKTNLEQRRGRAGRVREGYAFHLCSRARFDRLEVHQTPELLRTALHEIALMIKLLRLGSCRDFLGKAIEQPPIDAIIEAEFLLKEMKAFDQNDELTPLGKILARLPIEPRMGKMLIFGAVFGVGHACALISACTSLGEPFLLPPERKRLSRQQVNLACGKHSDHVAILNAFQKWEHVKRRNQPTEEEFCEQRDLSLSVMKMSNEAANQVTSILIDSGFPEETMYPNNIDFFNNSPTTDVLLSLLVLGLYPNVCYHKEKRKVLTTEGKAALVHKSSVNCSNFITNFPIPFFVFGEKIRTRAISCKQLSMVNPLQLLMFGCRKVNYSNNMIILDDWLSLDIDFEIAAQILALRPALEGLLVKVCLNPEMSVNPQPEDQQIIEIVSQLSSPSVCNPNQFDGNAASSQMMGVNKRPYGDYDGSGPSNKFRPMAPRAMQGFRGDRMGQFNTHPPWASNNTIPYNNMSASSNRGGRFGVPIPPAPNSFCAPRPPASISESVDIGSNYAVSSIGDNDDYLETQSYASENTGNISSYGYEESSHGVSQQNNQTQSYPTHGYGDQNKNFGSAGYDAYNQGYDQQSNSWSNNQYQEYPYDQSNHPPVPSSYPSNRGSYPSNRGSYPTFDGNYRVRGNFPRPRNFQRPGYRGN